MDYGAHLPLIDLDGQPFSLHRLVTYAQAAQHLGFHALAANDHLVFRRPWLDGPTALAAVLAVSGRMALMTTLALAVVRGPAALAKSLAAIDLLSGGRLVVGVGPGSSERDYAAVGLAFAERWQRFDEAIPALRALWEKDSPPFAGRFYNTDGLVLEPYPAQQPGPPIWIGSWGSEAGLQRTARLGDGWLASAYNSTPPAFATARQRLGEHLRQAGKDPHRFPNAIATMFLYVTEDRTRAERIVGEVLSPTLNRPARECAEKLAAYAAAGAQRVFVWPAADELRQLAVFQEQVAPLVPL